MKLFSALILMWSAQVSAQQVVIENAWIREAPPAAMSMAGYLTISNTSSTDISVTGVHSEAFANAMIHQTVIEDGLAKMRHQPTLTIPAGSRVVLEPNSYHLMLMRPATPLSVGETVRITFSLETGESIEFEAPVQPLQMPK